MKADGAPAGRGRQRQEAHAWKEHLGGKEGWIRGALGRWPLSAQKDIQILTQTGWHSEGREWQCLGLRMQDSGGSELGSSAQDPKGGQPVGLDTLWGCQPWSLADFHTWNLYIWVANLCYLSMAFLESSIDLPFYQLPLSCRGTHSGLPLTEGSFYQSPLLSFWGPCCPASDFPLVSVCSLRSFFCERHRPALKSPSCFRNQLQVHICHSCSL